VDLWWNVISRSELSLTAGAVGGNLPLGAELKPWKGLVMKYQKERVSLVDLSTGEEIVSADLTAPRVKAIVKAYALAGIQLVQKERVSA
jgi:hypothetical protein